MVVEWIRIFFDTYTQREKVLEAMEKIPHPHVELGIHVAFKCAETGGFVSSMIIAPIFVQWRRHYRQGGKFYRFAPRSVMWPAVRAACVGGCVGGILIAPVVTFGWWLYKQPTYTEVWDRCYRLRHNTDQLFFDRTWFIFSLLGLTFGKLGGFCIASNLALAFGATYNFAVHRFAYKKYLRLRNLFEDHDDF